MKTSQTVRFVGGGALAPSTCQILADVLGRRVETVLDPQNIGSVGAAIITACGLGEFKSVSDGARLVQAAHTYEPNPGNKQIYDRSFRAFKQLYQNNQRTFALLNGN
ncbi:hypothetical protein RQN30_07440 [Arcanobacterium hippocoleae]